MKLKNNIVETNVDKLHCKSELVDMNNSSLIFILESALLNAFNKLDCKAQGLAAIQCGKPYCAVLLRYIKGENPLIVFNPTVLLKIGRKSSVEGCLSEGETRYKVYRPLLIKVKYYTSKGLEIVEWLPYKKARIFMHEYDHLNGILLQDHGRPIN